MTDLFLWIHTNYSSPFFGGGPMENMANSNEYAMYIGVKESSFLYFNLRQ